jgi:heat shock protein HtpX
VSEPVNLFAQQEANRRRSRWLVIGFIAFFAWLGFGGDWVMYLGTVDARAGQYKHLFPWFGLLMTAIAAGLAWHGWRTGASKVLWATGAQPLDQPRTPAEKQLVNVVEEMAIAAGLPRPKLYIIRESDPNAFAAGRDPQSAVIAVTEGLLRVCSRDELQAVIAHEMGHIKNLDMQLMTLLASLVGTVAMISDGFGRMLRGGRAISGSSSRSKKGNPLFLLVLAIWLISWLLAPLITRLLALGVSRKREYLADAMSAQFTRNPLALANALEKIEREHAPTTSIQQSCAHLCIADPLGRAMTAREGWLADVLATHPPMVMRVSRLKAMAYQQAKRAQSAESVRSPISPVSARHGETVA